MHAFFEERFFYSALVSIGAQKLDMLRIVSDPYYACDFHIMIFAFVFLKEIIERTSVEPSFSIPSV